MTAWHDNFILTDDARLNRQFVTFFKLVTGLRLCSYASPEIHEQFERMAGFLPGHFRYEEEVMLRLGYPCVRRHAEIHDFLAKQLETTLGITIPSGYLGKIQACLVSCLENHLYIDDPEMISSVARIDDEVFDS